MKRLLVYLFVVLGFGLTINTSICSITLAADKKTKKTKELKILKKIIEKEKKKYAAIDYKAADKIRDE